MKKNITIFFLASFFLLQYGKVVSYLYCTYENYKQTGSVTCDCEKQLTDAPATTTTHNGHMHGIKTEECLQHIATNNLLQTPFNYIIVSYRAYQENTLHHPPKGLLRPPCAG
ncbi:MAG: hypothetical protein EAZ16_07890 [Sphingobacteriales bacterium]|nr:MAG: hypothetical protein EAZ16_07890 [Sphingobacteriales bacterium]